MHTFKGELLVWFSLLRIQLAHSWYRKPDRLILPVSAKLEALHLSHDVPTAGHQGVEKTLQRLHKMAYWVNMAKDVEQYCRNCLTCQQSKLSMPQRAPLQNVPIGQPWQMVAVDILQVPLSTNNNRYLLVLQDYFTKWADAVPLPDQTASRITTALIKFFCTYGPPQIIHSDQGRNFESTIFKQVLEAFGVRKSRTTHKGMVWLNVLIGVYCNYYELMLLPKVTGKHI